MTNTWRHALIGAAIGLLWLLLCLIPGMWQLEGLGFIGFLFATIAWENAQRLNTKQWNWVDSLVDVFAGNAGFFIGYNVLLRLTANGWIV